MWVQFSVLSITAEHHRRNDIAGASDIIIEGAKRRMGAKLKIHFFPEFAQCRVNGAFAGMLNGCKRVVAVSNAAILALMRERKAGVNSSSGDFGMEQG